MTTIDILTAARAEALFTSDLSAAEQPTRAEVTAAIRRMVRAHGGTRGCAGEVAAAYGEHPDTAVTRMRWARALVERTFPGHSAPRRPSCVPTLRAAATTASPPPAVVADRADCQVQDDQCAR